MVRIINYIKRQTEDAKVFFVLELQSGIEMALSAKTGQYYATAKKANITSTFDEETCKALIGTEMPGTIVKVESDSFEYTVRETGEIITLTHKYVYVPEVEAFSKEDRAIQKLFSPEKTFSKNGHFEEFAI
jgi:hypothetical protein